MGKDDVFKRYYEKVRVCNYQLFPEKDFQKVLLEKENEYFVYTKERLFPFFEEDGRRLLTIFTRGFFEYARKQGCIGEFVENIEQNNQLKTTNNNIDTRLNKVHKILDLLCIECKIKGKTNSFIPYSKAKINYLKAYLEDYLNDKKIEDYSPITTDDAAADYRNYAMESCFNVLYPTSEEQNKNKQKWQKMFCLIFNLSSDTWRKGRSRKPSDNAFIEAVDGIVYDIKKDK